MNCKHCNAEIPEGEILCPVCGKEQEIPEETPAEALAEVTEEVTPVEETVEAAMAEETAENAEPEKKKLPFETDYEEADQAQIKEGVKATPGKIALAVVAGVVVLAILVALVVSGLSSVNGAEAPTIAPTAGVVEETVPVTIPSDGDPTSPLCKASYTVSDEEAAKTADVVVATMGDRELTNAELQAYYWQEIYLFLQENGMYAEYLGLNMDTPLDQQLFTLSEVPMSWQQFFLDGAIGTWQNYQAMELQAAEAGYQLSEEDQAELDSEPENLSAAATKQGFESAEALIKARIGAACTEKAYMNYMRVYYTYMSYYNHYHDNMELTEEEIDAFFAEHEEDYTAGGVARDTKYVDVRHVLLQPEGGETGEDGYPVFTDEAWEACLKKVEDIYNKWQEGDKSEESFAELAKEYSVDGSASAGGLYENVYEGQMVEEFENWCFDETRQVGDHGLVKTRYGYHIMFFCGSRSVVEYDMRNERAYNLIPAALEKYPPVVDYSLIALGEQKLF